jgi:hypothetical protein
MAKGLSSNEWVVRVAAGIALLATAACASRAVPTPKAPWRGRPIPRE